MLDQVEPELVYIGPLYKLSPVAMQTDSEATPVLKALDSIRERGCALIIEAHAGKGQELAPRGSAAFQGWPEFGRGLRKSIDDPDKFLLEEWRGDRDVRDIPTALKRGGRALQPDIILRGGEDVAAPAAELHPICQVFLRACEEAGLPRNPDFNGADQEGIGYSQVTIGRGRTRFALSPAVSPNQAGVSFVLLDQR